MAFNVKSVGIWETLPAPFRKPTDAGHGRHQKCRVLESRLFLTSVPEVLGNGQTPGMARADDEQWEPGVVPRGGVGAGPAAGSRWAAVRGTAVLIGPDGWLPSGGSPEEAGITTVDDAEPLFLGALGNEEVWAADAGTDGDEAHGHGLEAVDLMSLHGRVGEQRWAIAGRAVQLVEWARTHRYCGRCASRPSRRLVNGRDAAPAADSWPFPASHRP